MRKGGGDELVIKYLGCYEAKPYTKRASWIKLSIYVDLAKKVSLFLDGSPYRRKWEKKMKLRPPFICSSKTNFLIGNMFSSRLFLCMQKNGLNFFLLGKT